MLDKPINPYFSSGPCRKWHGYKDDNYINAPIARARHSPEFTGKISELIVETKSFLELPEGHEIVIVPGSDTGAIESAFWNLLGYAPVIAYSWSVFGNKWINDIRNELKIENFTTHEFGFMNSPTFHKPDINSDIVLVWNATTVGMAIDNIDWISDDHKGLVIVDGTSTVFTVKLPWDKIDVFSFGWQKIVGSEASIGTLVLSPKAINRLNTYKPSWPIPALLKLNVGSVANSTSAIIYEDALLALRWLKKKYNDIDGVIGHLETNYNIIKKFVDSCDKINFMVDENFRSRCVCYLMIDGFDQDDHDNMIKHMKDNDIAYDINPHPKINKGIRIWIGPTIDTLDIERLCDNIREYIE